MDRKKMMQQAKVLRDKKYARMKIVAKQLRPKVENGVVKYDKPQSQEVRKFAAPPLPVKSARPVLPAQHKSEQSQQAQQQKINPQTVTRRSKGCSGCRRKSGSK